MIKNIWEKNLIIFFVCIIVCGIIGMVYVMPPEFDFLNFKYYNGWAFFNNRYDIDIMPSTFRTFFNPLLDTANFILFDNLNQHPYMYLFLNGIRFGLFIFITYLIYDFVLINKNFSRQMLIFSGIVMTFFSPIVIYLTGYGYTDMTLAILTLISIFLFIKFIFQKKNFKTFIILFLSALIIGMCTGFKYTQGSFGISFIISIILFYKSIDKPVKSILLMLFGMFCGFLITDGYWMYTLWTHFKNPFFPYFNSFFLSPYGDTYPVFTTDFDHLRAKNLLELILTPFKNTRKGNIGVEWAFFDLKLPFTFIAIFAYCILAKVKKNSFSISELVNTKIFNMLIMITILAYSTNTIIFGQLRYILALFPIFSIIILLISYGIFSMNKNEISELYNPYIFLFMIVLYFHYTNFYELGSLEKPAILLAVFYAIIIITICFSHKLTNRSKHIYIGISLVVLSFLCTTKYFRPPIDYKGFKTISYIENLEFKDFPNIICGPNMTNFIAVKNPNARYIGLAIPENFEKDGWWTKNSPFRNMYYKDTKQEERIKKIFEENKDLYFIYSQHGSANSWDWDLYIKTLNYYSKGKIKEVHTCKNIKYYFFDTKSNHGDVTICKIKSAEK